MLYENALHIRAYRALDPLPQPVIAVLRALESAGHEAWIVGGFVRDALRGVEPHDADIATSALWEETRDACLARGLAVYETGTQHGTVTVVAQGYPIEVTTYRTEGTYSDHRHPDSVMFVKSIREDLARRDFTVNAMAFHPVRGLLDPFEGQADLHHGIIRCVGDPVTRFSEDALRVMRALRFASQLSFRMNPDTELALFKTAPSLEGVAGERLSAEIERMLCGSAIHDVLMRYVDILGVVLPSLLPMKGFDQHTHWHVYDVLEHTAYVIQNTPPYPLARWAALFHDMGKPDTFIMDSNGVGHMPGHPIISVDHLNAAAKRLKFSRRMTRDLSLLVRYHDNHPTPTRKSVRKLFAKLEHDEHLFHVICDVMRGDALGQAPFSHKRVTTINDVEALFDEMLAEGDILTVHDLPVSGEDIIALGVPEGPQVGLLLNELFNAVANESIEPEREALLAYAAKLNASSQK